MGCNLCNFHYYCIAVTGLQHNPDFWKGHMYELLEFTYCKLKTLPQFFLQMRPQNHPKSKMSIELPPCARFSLNHIKKEPVGYRGLLGSTFLFFFLTPMEVPVNLSTSALRSSVSSCGCSWRSKRCTLLGGSSFARFCQQEFGEFPWPAWAVGSYSSGPPAGELPKFLLTKPHAWRDA